jgi:hypothetical protein
VPVLPISVGRGASTDPLLALTNAVLTLELRDAAVSSGGAKFGISMPGESKPVSVQTAQPERAPVPHNIVANAADCSRVIIPPVILPKAPRGAMFAAQLADQRIFEVNMVGK